MNICFVLIEYPFSLQNGNIVKDFSGGAGSIMYDVVHGLKKRGHNIFVVARSIGIKEDHSFNDNGVEVYKFTANNHIYLTIKITNFLKQFVPKKQIDIIETCDYAPMISEYINDVPILLRQHISHAYIEYFAGKITSPYQIKDVNYLHYVYSLHLADSIAGVSNYILKNQSEFHQFAQNKLYGVVYNGIEMTTATNNYNRHLCFCHGTVSKRKGTHQLCNIFNEVNHVRPAARLLVIGAGERFWRDSCLPLLSEQAQNNTSYLNYLDRNDTLRHISNAGIYISMSNLEAMSISMLEAMTLGKPLVLLRNGSFEEFITSGQEGFLISNEQEAIDKIIQLQDDITLYNNCSVAAMEKAKKYSLDNCITETEKWYLSVLQNKQEILSQRNYCFNSLLQQYYYYIANATKF